MLNTQIRQLDFDANEEKHKGNAACAPQAPLGKDTVQEIHTGTKKFHAH